MTLPKRENAAYILLIRQEPFYSPAKITEALLQKRAARAEWLEEWIWAPYIIAVAMPMFQVKAGITSEEFAGFRFRQFAKALQSAVFPAENMSEELWVRETGSLIVPQLRI